jgi:response regulator RpfG family c-di-GMP phosphodiesterase
MWSLLERANCAAEETELPELLGATLALLAESNASSAGMLFLLDEISGELICETAWGSIPTALDGAHLPGNLGLAGEALRLRQPVLLENPSNHPDWHGRLDALSQLVRANVLAVPLVLERGAVGLVLLIDCQQPDLEISALLARRLSSEVARAARLDAQQVHNERLSAMLGIFQQIGATLDRDKLLRMMIDYARLVINAEACSLFLVDEATQDNVLYLATNASSQISPEKVRVPAGAGIIGHVIDNGCPVLVPDVSKDERHYQKVDQDSGFVTRAILAVPLRTRTLVLGAERGTVHTRVIGGFEAVNKIKGTFNEEDARLLGTLANQAATVLQIAELYNDATDLFLDVIKALAAAIDAKDPYTEGHSQRVSDFAVSIGRHLELDGETLHQVRIGSLLHDMGKIGIPDRILVKPGTLSPDEFQIMKQHPTIGANILTQVGKLRAELPALAEHHERLDGSGYPLGLKGEQISQMGRIVSVADVFDAMTSDRPYREGMPVDEVMDYLYQYVDVQYDRRCLDALTQALLAGEVQTQHMRAGS